MKKTTVGAAVLASSVLVMTGCSTDGTLLRDATVNSMEKGSYNLAGSFKLTGNFDEVLKKQKALTDEQVGILESVKEGISFEGVKGDTASSKLTMSLNNDKALRDHKVWEGKDKASIEMIVDKQDIYVKSPIDKKYLKYAQDMQLTETNNIDPELVKKFSEDVNNLSMKFANRYIKGFDFKGSSVQNKGEETVKLPNGEELKATHLIIELDTKNLIELAYYIAKDATVNPEVRSFAIDLTTMATKFSDKAIEAKKTLLKDEEYRKNATDQVDLMIAAAKVGIADFEKENSPEKLVELAKTEGGLQNLKLKLDYWIDKDKLPVRSTVTLDVTMKDPKATAKDATPITFGFIGDSYQWNFGKATPFVVPSKNDVVNFADLAKDKDAIKNFDEKGFFHKIIKEVQAQQEEMKAFEAEMEALEAKEKAAEAKDKAAEAKPKAPEAKPKAPETKTK
ncbi:hypothetical protein GOP56_12370 [Brevibacillus sp. 7WMA2]|uniref:hypothetical protein n=1 Tax=Brevibacillus TaxID=55080 RepID=UPI0013A797CB|nr:MULTISPECIES: hypothetical protein [Brevibacillus]MCR8996430.1 hypothetical protein [Brevibacillus laterosporus]QIC06327.1 hypothetical protein GOP56_12370 [Brevibacillus sp. 7WMA2]WPS87203.1 hypothetical protein SMD22_22385 [Brevibacillus halotolerans]